MVNVGVASSSSVKGVRGGQSMCMEWMCVLGRRDGQHGRMKKANVEGNGGVRVFADSVDVDQVW